MAPPATAPPETPAAAPAAAPSTSPPATAPAAAPPNPPPAAGPVKIHFSEDKLDKSVGDTVSVSILVDNARSVVSAPFMLQYDPKILTLNDVTPGKFWSSDGEDPIMIKNVQNDTGLASVRLSRKPGSAAVAGSGTLLTLSFKAVAPGSATVSATNIQLNNSQDQLVGSGSPKIAINVK
jgi:general secretion pathway protein D